MWEGWSTCLINPQQMSRSRVVVMKMSVVKQWIISFTRLQTLTKRKEKNYSPKFKYRNYFREWGHERSHLSRTRKTLISSTSRVGSPRVTYVDTHVCPRGRWDTSSVPDWPPLTTRPRSTQYRQTELVPHFRGIPSLGRNSGKPLYHERVSSPS